jgi:hypothetical protein
MTDADFAALVEPVARHFWGEPNKGLSTKVSLRWGSGGSRAVFLDGPGNWKDFEADEGGGVIDLVMRELACDKAGALEWLESEGFIQPREKSPQMAQDGRSAPPAMEVPPEQESPPADEPEGKLVPVKGYHYTDRDGNLLYDVIRRQWQLPDGSFVLSSSGTPKKTFSQRRPAGDGTYAWALSEGEYMRAGPGKDWIPFDADRFAKWPRGERGLRLPAVTHTIYRHPEVEIAIAEGRTVYLPEGEKDADTLVEWGLCGTTNSGGAKNWTSALAELFRGADVVILVDNDETGIAAGEAKALSLRGIARRIRVLNFADHVPGFPKKGDVTDWRDRFGGDASRLGEILNTLPDWTPAPPASKFAARSGRQIAGSKIVYDWLIKGLVERGGVFIVAGEKQAGKSFFMMDMAGKIALGRDYCERKVRQGLVIYVAAEDRPGVDMRYEGWRRENQIPEDQDVPFVIMGGYGGKKFSLLDDESVDELIAECRAWEAYYGLKLELVVVDTFSVVTEGLDEIHSGEVGKVLGRINRLAQETKAAVCLVHHMNGEGSRVRGHSSLTANVSQVIEIKNLTKPQQKRWLPPELIKDADGRIIRKAVLDKNKNGPNRIQWRFVLRQVKLGLDDDGYEITTCVLDRPSSEPDEGQIKTGRLSPDQKLVYDALQAAIEDAGTPIPTNARAGSGVRLCVEQKAFIAAVRRVWQFRAPDDEQEARNKELQDVLKRNVTALINGGYIGRDNDLKIVWLTGKEDRPKPEPRPADKPPALPDDVKQAMQEGVPF